MDSDELEMIQEKRMIKTQLVEEIFESFLRVSFLLGTPVDWVPFSSKNGPLLRFSSVS